MLLVGGLYLDVREVADGWKAASLVCFLPATVPRWPLCRTATTGIPGDAALLSTGELLVRLGQRSTKNTSPAAVRNQLPMHGVV